MIFYIRIKKGLVHAMRSNGPLHQVEYLESVHQGEFITGTMESVHNDVYNAEKSEGYKPPTNTLPEYPPPSCKKKVSRMLPLLVPWDMVAQVQVYC
jgi:hypothetical protein